MKLDLVLGLVPGAYAAPISSAKNAVRTAQHLTTAQVKAIEAAVKRKFEKQRGQKGNELRVWQDKAIAAAKLVNEKAKLAKESAIEQSQLREATSRGGFWGLVERARKRVISKPQRVAVLPDGDFLNGKRLFTDETIAAFKRSPALEQISSDGTKTLIKTKIGNQEMIVAISDISLGGGSFGDTYIAQNVATNEWIAFKRLKIQAKENSYLFGSDISKETRAWRSQSMLKTEIVEFADGSKGFGMELVKGQTLEKAFADAKSLDELRDIFERGIIAIKKMHQGGVTHGDAHPGNILTGGHLVDFGSIRPLNIDTLYIDYLAFIYYTKKTLDLSQTPLSKQFTAELDQWMAQLHTAIPQNRQQLFERMMTETQ
jgi:hypothetical protein